MFYSSVVESIVLFDILRYWYNLNVGQKEQTRRLQMKVEKITRYITPIYEHYGPISHPVVKSVVKCMVITRLSKWFGIELHCVSTDRVSDLAAIEWFRSQRLTTGYLMVMGGDQPHHEISQKYTGNQGVISFILILRDHNIM